MRFLFCSFETPGFLYPSIGIAQELEARGHDTAFIADYECSELLAAHHLRRIPRGPNDGHSFQVALWAKPISVAIQVKHIEYALASFGADVLVGQSLTLGPLLVAERRQIPVGLMGFCTYLWPPGEVTGCGDSAESLGRARWRLGEMLEFLNQARAMFRLSPFAMDECGETPLLGDLFLLRSVPELEANFEALPQCVHLVGSCLWEPDCEDQEVCDWLRKAESQGAPVVYVQHGRYFHIPRFWESVVQALEDQGCFVAASSDRLDGEVVPIPVDSLIRPHLPQGHILPVAKIVIASANTTAVLGALEAGVPCLLIPGGGEQPDVAALAERVGVAKCLSPNDATPSAIGKAIRELLSDARYRQRAEYFKAFFAKHDGFKCSSDLLERLAVTKRPVLRH